MVILDWLYEYWLPVRGYEGLYEVSNFGRIKSVERILEDGRLWKEKILVPRKNKKGYMKVALSKNGKTKFLFVHRIVAETFLTNTNSYPCINHKSENKIENFVWNLEWCSYEYNNNYGSIKQKILDSRKIKNCSNAETPVIQYTKDMAFVKEYKSQAEASTLTKINQSSICLCMQGKQKTAGGYIWKYGQ